MTGVQTCALPIFDISKRALVVCLFLIGCGISVEKLKAAGPKPLMFGITMWVLISVGSLSWLLFA